jgi:hypothetical protein
MMELTAAEQKAQAIQDRADNEALLRKLKAQKQRKGNQDFLADFQRQKQIDNLMKLRVEKTGIETADIYHRA